MPIRIPPPAKRLILLAGDALAATAAVAVALAVRHGGLPEPTLLGLYLFATPFLVGLWITGLLMFGLYDLAAAKNEAGAYARLARAIIANGIVTFLTFQLIPEFRLTPRATMVIIFTAGAALLFGWRLTAHAALARMGGERVLFLGTSDEVFEVARHLAQNPQLGYQPALGIQVQAGEQSADPAGRLAVRTLPPAGLAAVIRHEAISVITVSARTRTDARFLRLLFEALPLGIRVVEFTRFSELILGKVPTSLIGEAWFLENLIGSSRPHYEFSKRIFDLTAATVIGGLTLVFTPFIALAIALSTPRDIFRYRRLRAHAGDGIVFFRQKRVGRNGVNFGFIKFRSQRLGAERLGWEKGSGPDPRAYPVGNFLRATYLDELPQVWNVIKGEMSFVGPRPERPEFVRELEARIPFYRIRELVLPGITGWAQLNMENDASVSDAPIKLQYDLYYLKNRSLFLDALILVRTALKLLQRSGR